MRYRIIILVVIALLVIAGGLAFLFGQKDGGTATAIISFWGFDDPAAWSQIITAYKAKYPNVTVNYTQKDPVNYEKELLNALASGAGPDIAAINNTWLNKHLGKFSPFPATLINAQGFKNTFVDVALADLARDEKVFAAPFYVDTLALYYNKSLFNNAGIVNPPKTWSEFNSSVKSLVGRDEAGNIIRAGAALGNASNVNYAADILNLLMLQTGTVMVSPNQEEMRATFDQTVNLENKSYAPGLEALNFYTDFSNSAKPVYTWNNRMPNSLTAFSQGKVAMYIGYAKDLKFLRESGIDFGVAPIPQVKDSKTDPAYLDVNFANYSAGAVTLASANKDTAWDFLLFAVSRNASGAYLNAAFLPTARRDLVQFQYGNPETAVFAKQSLTAFSWPQPDDVEITKIFNRLIDTVALGQATSANAIKEAAIEVTNLLK